MQTLPPSPETQMLLWRRVTLSLVISLLRNDLSLAGSG